MATGTWTTTAEEDAAIEALTASAAAVTKTPPETVAQFIDRHIRHQVDFALSQATTTKRTIDAAAYDAATPDDKAAVDAILSKTKGAKP